MGICTDPDILNIIRIGKLLITLLEVGIIVALIIYAMVDIIKLIVSSDVDTKKTINKMIKRLIAACVVLLVPVIINTAMQLVSSTMDYENCLDNANDAYINKAYIDKADEYVAKAMESLSRHDLNLAERYVNKVTDESVKSNLLSRINSLKDYINDQNSDELPDIYTSLGNYANVSGYYSDGTCQVTSTTTKLGSEPDPSCTINYWLNKGGGEHVTLSASQYVYPKDSETGLSLGAWPKNVKEASKLTNYKTYGNANVIFPTNKLGVYSYEHFGVDFVNSIGTPVYAPASGTLVFSEWGWTANNLTIETAYSVMIKLDKPLIYNGRTFIYAYMTHLSGITNRCGSKSKSSCNGKRVEKGDLIGYMGVAASWSHIHFDYCVTTKCSDNSADSLSTSEIYSLYSTSGGTVKGAGQ